MADRPKCGDVTPKEDTNPNEDKVNEWDGKRTKWMGTTKGRERCLVTNVVDKGKARRCAGPGSTKDARMGTQRQCGSNDRRQ